MYRSLGKRVVDVALALLACIIVVPIIILGYVLVRLSSPGPGFFVQERLGRQGKTFKVFKLRTMTTNPERNLSQTTNADPEVFAVGRYLRRTKIDELPQIFNVVKGDMSIVGPRPGLPSMLDEMPKWAKARLSERPGLTGLAQVNGNIELSWEQRWKYDVQYVGEISLLNDLKIILRTVLVVIFGESTFRRLP
jgi:lipopolysaccharide/colanic/teichoic acid biosynthesis glycosyltransferase